MKDSEDKIQMLSSPEASDEEEQYDISDHNKDDLWEYWFKMEELSRWARNYLQMTVLETWAIKNWLGAETLSEIIFSLRENWQINKEWEFKL